MSTVIGDYSLTILPSLRMLINLENMKIIYQCILTYTKNFHRKSQNKNKFGDNLKQIKNPISCIKNKYNSIFIEINN